ncbi:MAG: sialidase family protein [Bryobacteraceae bacterium]
MATTFRILLLSTALACQAQQFGVTDLTTRTVYHSPETPGFTSWVGLWLMPSGNPMVSFHQATGPAQGRYRASKEIRHLLSWPPTAKPEHAGYDMTGLDLEVIHLESGDAGATWRHVHSEHASTPMNGWTCEPEVAAAGGTIYRAVWGQYLPFYDVPQTGYWQRSTDGAKTWSEPAVFFDRQRWDSLPKRMRLLRDGRLVVAGGVIPHRPGLVTRNDWAKLLEPAVWVSADLGKTWSDPILVWDDKTVRPSEELDVAELPNGDLLAVIRVDAAKSRYQTRLRKSGATWRPEPVRKLWIPHSGHPELLATREGPVLHLATDGIAYTADEGKTWQYLDGRPKSGYYPRSVQLPDGRVLCVYHVGGDNAYGAVDQRVEAISFRVKR